VFGVIEGPVRGWSDGLVVAALVAGTGALGTFVAWELRVSRPLLDPRLFRLRGFGTGSVSITAQFFAAFGFFFIALQYLQYVAGRSPLEAALAMLPLPFVLIPVARRAPSIAQRLGVNRTGPVGLLLIAGGLAVISRIEVDLDYAVFAAGLVLFAAGMGLAGTPATTAIVSSLPASKQGVASAVNDVSREFGSAMGIAVLGSVLNDRYRGGIEDVAAQLPPDVGQGAAESIAFVQRAPLERFGAAGAELQVAAEQAFVDAASRSLLVAAAVLVVAALYVALRGPGREAAPAVERRREPGAVAGGAH
jgi:hypothetical protein